jgi:hypothetical protein
MISTAIAAAVIAKAARLRLREAFGGVLAVEDVTP